MYFIRFLLTDGIFPIDLTNEEVEKVMVGVHSGDEFDGGALQQTHTNEEEQRKHIFGFLYLLFVWSD